LMRVLSWRAYLWGRAEGKQGRGPSAVLRGGAGGAPALGWYLAACRSALRGAPGVPGPLLRPPPRCATRWVTF
jgi:hypothetical protein